MNRMPFEFPTKYRKAITLFALGLFAFVAGCSEDKESLHEIDHVVPAHWPKDMADAADKIRKRLSIVKSDSSQKQARKELRDLIEWVPEIVADTDLAEKQWLPIHGLSEALRLHLLPVCSIGVIPILREMKRIGIRPGAITAFALSAPLFNPLSLMYGLTLSRIIHGGFNDQPKGVSPRLWSQ